jgi:RNA 2',3'-cyclic 3'-phosphodiesterase
MRLFFAIDIGAAQRAALRDAVAALQPVAPRAVRWVEPAGAHITLSFLGEVAAERTGQLLAAAQAALAALPSFTLHLAPASAFPNLRRPRTLWLGLAGQTDVLTQVQGRLADALVPLGFARERRPFRPHLTLGRVREGASPAELAALGATLPALPAPDPMPWLVDMIVLYHSELGPQGARYTSMGKVGLV